MKKLSVIIILTTCILSLQATRIGSPTTITLGNIFLPSTTTSITSNSFGNSTNLTYSILEAGRYQLRDSIIFNPSTAKTSIYINSNDVILDLGGQTLTLKRDNATENILGIEIASNCSNVTIRNGQITGFSGESIKIGLGCTNIIIENIHINNAKNTGIVFAGTQNNKIISCSLKNILIANISGLGNSTLKAYGIKITHAEGITIEDSKIIGMRTGSTQNDSYGCHITNSKNIVLNDVHSGSHDGAECCAFYVKNSSIIQMNNCEAAGCTSYTNSTTGASGFCFNSSNGCILDECISIGHTGKYSSYGTRFSSCTGIIMKKCNSLGNQLSSDNVENSHCCGFYSEQGSGNTWHNCEASSNSGGSADGSFVAGFLLDNGECQSTITHCIAQSNGDLTFTARSYGFWLSNATADINHCHIKDCSALNNCSGTQGGAIGFYDDRVDSTLNLFVDNYAYGNLGSTTTTNYNVTIAPPGVFNLTDANSGNILDLASKPLYYNISITN